MESIPGLHESLKIRALLEGGFAKPKLARISAPQRIMGLLKIVSGRANFSSNFPGRGLQRERTQLKDVVCAQFLSTGTRLSTRAFKLQKIFLQPWPNTFAKIFFFFFLLRVRVCWPLLCLYRPFLFLFVRDFWIRNQRAAEGSGIATHLPADPPISLKLLRVCKRPKFCQPRADNTA